MTNPRQVHRRFGDSSPGCTRYAGARPLAASSPADFWRRWHISLSSWLRDYVYIGLGGNRGSNARTHLNSLATMGLGCLWHGAGWTYVLWGLFHGAALSVERALPLARSRVLLGWAVTTTVVCSGWILFRAATFSDSGIYAARVLTAASALEVPAPALLAWLAPLAALVAFGQSPFGAALERRSRRWGPALRMALAGFVVVLAYALSAGEERAFVYFQF